MELKMIISFGIMAAAVVAAIVGLAVASRRAAPLPERKERRLGPVRPLYTGYNNLPVCVYLKLLEATKKPAEDGMPEILAALCGVPVEKIEALPLDKYAALVAETDWLQHDPELVPVRRRYFAGDGLMLTLFKDRNGLTFGQYTDLQSILQAPLLDVLCIALVPEGHSYADGYDMDAVREGVAKYVTLCDALAIRGFFVKRLNRLTMRFLTCSAVTALRGMRKAKTPEVRDKWRKALKETMKAMADTQRAGAGLRRSMKSARLPVALGKMLCESLQ